MALIETIWKIPPLPNPLEIIRTMDSVLLGTTDVGNDIATHSPLLKLYEESVHAFIKSRHEVENLGRGPVLLIQAKNVMDYRLRLLLRRLCTILQKVQEIEDYLRAFQPGLVLDCPLLTKYENVPQYGQHIPMEFFTERFEYVTRFVRRVNAFAYTPTPPVVHPEICTTPTTTKNGETEYIGTIHTPPLPSKFTLARADPLSVVYNPVPELIRKRRKRRNTVPVRSSERLRTLNFKLAT